MDGRLSSVQIEELIDLVWAKEKWLALFSTNPLVVGDPLAVEISGGSYTRHQAEWVRTAYNLITLDSAVAFTNLLPGTTVAAIGVMDAAFNGTLIGSSLVPGAEPASYPTGGALTIPTGTYALGLDVTESP